MSLNDDIKLAIFSQAQFLDGFFGHGGDQSDLGDGTVQSHLAGGQTLQIDEVSNIVFLTVNFHKVCTLLNKVCAAARNMGVDRLTLIGIVQSAGIGIQDLVFDDGSLLLAEMEQEGFGVDKEGIEDYGKVLKEKMQKAEESIYAIANTSFFAIK